MKHSHNYRDITGQTIGHLTAIRPSQPKVYFYKKKNRKILRSIWVFRCVCGKEIERSRVQIERHLKNPPSCGCQSIKGNQHPYWNGVGEFSKTHFTAIKNSAIRRKLDFNLTIEYLWELFLKQDRTCALSGEQLKFGTYAMVHNKELRVPTASLDRIDSTKGYVEGNVQWVHKTLNKMKMELGDKEFIQWCYKVCDYKSKDFSKLAG